MKLTSLQMATFVAKGYLRFDGVVPEDLNQRLLERFSAIDPSQSRHLGDYYGKAMAERVLPVCDSGVPLTDLFQHSPDFRALLDIPTISGAIQSLLGERPIFDHHFLHVTIPPSERRRMGMPDTAQHYHQDSTIDPSMAFDIQLFYFPQEVTEPMGGTRFLPGSHLRVVSEAAISRYQNIVGQQHVVCPAGTVLIFHKGLWHGGGLNRSDQTRFLYKIRLAPGGSQVRQWNTDDLTPADAKQRATFWQDTAAASAIQETLMRPEPWFEFDTGRLEMINRVKLWRYLLGDASADVDYWLTRLERPQMSEFG